MLRADTSLFSAILDRPKSLIIIFESSAGLQRRGREGELYWNPKTSSRNEKLGTLINPFIISIVVVDMVATVVHLSLSNKTSKL